ncbi:MAG: CinA family protein, partial [Clostridia bacterium]|nr:CinA family protein [Clostridia bacterium]
IAGPTSDSTSKPVGLVYIAVALGDDFSVFEYNLSGDRENITNTAINLALFHTYKLLK